MPYCPHCGYEYTEEVIACPDCGRPLESNSLSEEEENPDIALVPVYNAPDEYTAELIKGILEGEGIEVMLKGEQVPIFDGALEIASGYWGQVLVKEEDAERSREILIAYEAQSASLEEGVDSAVDASE